jgi:hypothetical protein
MCEMDSSGSGQGSVLATCKHNNKPMSYIKGGKYLDQLIEHQLHNNDPIQLISVRFQVLGGVSLGLWVYCT